MPYVEITQKEFEDVLNHKGYKWKRLNEPMAKENIYLVEDNGFGIKIFSSIVEGIGRGVGADAIRVVGWDPVSGLPVFSSESRVYRTEGWRGNLIERINNVKEKMTGVRKCQICGSIMVERLNKQTQQKFFGCLNYKNHSKINSGGEKQITNKNNKIDNNNTSIANNMMTKIAMEEIKKVSGVGLDLVLGKKEDKEDVNVDRINDFHNDTLVRPTQITNPIIKNININGEEIKFVEITGNERLIDTRSYHWNKIGEKIAYGFENFNVIQSEVINWVQKDFNAVIQAKTSTGKTIMGELFMWPVLAEGKKVIYTSPLKALTREKWDSWIKKFGEVGYKLAIVTGDYRLTDNRIKELNEANIILCTSEMLDHRTRNVASEKSEWLMKAGLIIVDEVQLIGMKDRGDKLEAGLMRFSLINPGCKLVMLSGTMPNSTQIAGWLKGLNKKETVLVKSEWRPIKLNMVFKKYNDKQGYYPAKESLMKGIMAEVEKHQKDKILIFVHSKTDGRKIMGMLGAAGIPSEFHNADLETDDRVNIEESFKSRAEGSIRIIIATSTLAYGLNLPARIVIIAGMHRGIDEVSELDIIQMCGRSGRMGIDTEGDAIILLPETQFDYLKKKIENPGDIISQINHPLIAGFHIIGEIVNRNVVTRNDVYRWYNRTLASRQDVKIDKDYVDKLVDYLIRNEAIKEIDSGIGDGVKKLVETEVGKACTYFYLRPDVLKDMMDNWDKIFAMGIENNDFVLTRALSRIRSYDEMIVSKSEKSYIESYHKASKSMEQTFGGGSEGQSKVGQAYLNMIKGVKGVEVIDGKKVINPLASLQRGLQNDIERIFQSMMYIDAKYSKWGKGSFWSSIGVRMKYGIGPELVDLVKLEGVGGSYAKKLYDAGIKASVELVTKKKEAIMALGARYPGIVLKNKRMFEMMGYKVDDIDLPKDAKTAKETTKEIKETIKELKETKIDKIPQKETKRGKIAEEDILKLPF
jgi:replicative superfamily II helicase